MNPTALAGVEQMLQCRLHVVEVPAPRHRVMVIDHDARFHHQVLMLLSDQPTLQVLTPEDVEHMADTRPDVLILGWSSPVKALLRRLRPGDGAWRPLLVVFADDGDLAGFMAAKGCRAGAVHYRCNLEKALGALIRQLDGTDCSPRRMPPRHP